MTVEVMKSLFELITLINLLPLMYTYEILDILFWVKNLKRPDPSLPIHDFILFSSSSTRAGCTSKFVHQESSTSASSHSYFRRVTRLWNALPGPAFSPWLFALSFYPFCSLLCRPCCSLLPCSIPVALALLWLLFALLLYSCYCLAYCSIPIALLPIPVALLLSL